MLNIPLRFVLQALATALPLFILWIVGIVIAIIHWKKSPKKSIFTLLAILITGFGLILEVAWNLFGIRWINTSRSGIRVARTLMTAAPLILNLVRTGGWIFVLLSIFSKTKVTKPNQTLAPEKEK